MLSERERLEHIRENCVFALELVAGLSADELTADRTKLYAAVRCLEIISEASRHLSSDLKLRHGMLPWTDIAGAGNIYRHDYVRVRSEVVLYTIQDALPPLLAAVESELSL